MGGAGQCQPEQDDCRTAPRPDGPARTQACLPGHGAEQLLSFWRLQGRVPPGFPGPGSSEPLGKGGGCSLRLGSGGTQGQAESSLEKGNLHHSNKYFSPISFRKLLGYSEHPPLALSHSPSGQGPPLDQMLLWQTGRGHEGEFWAMGLLRFLSWGVLMQSAQKPLPTWILQLCIRKPHCR